MPTFDIGAAPVLPGQGLLMGLDPTYQAQQLQNKLTQVQLDRANAFRSGLPTNPDGSVNTDAMARTELQLGDFNNAGGLLSLGLRQRLLGNPGSIDDPLGRGGATGPQASASPSSGTASLAPPSTQGLNPEVVNFVRDTFGSRNIDPNYALKVGISEGLRGFDPSGNANPGDGNSSFGPFQLHYGHVAGAGAGNQSPGLGDDFTAATGLDARNPSTWKQQVIFAADHVAKNGWGAFHGANAAGIGQWDGINRGGSTATAYAPQPTDAPGQAAIGAATGQQGQQPYRVASLGPTAAPGSAQPVAPAPQPATAQPPTFGARNGQPTADSSTTQPATPAEWAAKFNPRDPALPGRIADALSIDPNEAVDVQDENIRRAVIPVLQASARGMAQGGAASGQPSSATQAGAPVADSDRRPPGTVHPYGAAPPGPLAGAASGAQPFAPVPAPVAAAQDARQPVAGTGPDIPGLPAAYQQPGGAQRYVNDVLTMAGQFEDAGIAGKAKAYTLRAQQVQAQLEAAQKAGIELQTHNAEMTPEQKNFAQMQRYGFSGSPLDLQAAQEQQKAVGNAQGRNLVLTPGEKEYNQAVQGGFQGSQAQYEASKASGVEEAKGQASYLGGMPKQLAADADNARQTSNSIDQMLTAAQGFRMGSGAQMDQTTRKVMQGVFTRLGADDPSLNDSTASYEDFGKLAGVLNRQAAKQVGGRTGIQEMQLIGSTLPSPEMTYDGFRGVAASLKGTSDYQVARQQASQDWLADPGHNSSLRGFDASFNKNAVPSAFWLNRLRVDQPDLFSQTVAKLGQSDQGKALLAKAKSGMAWANQAGLLDQ